MALELTVCKNYDEFYDKAVRHIVAELTGVLKAQKQASLFLCGGTTPAPVYDSLSSISLDWSNINIGLVDERWVDEHDPGSNAALVRKHMLTGHAKFAPFTPMKTSAQTALDGQSETEAAYSKLIDINSLAVLGMGPDGHIGAWFPKADVLDQALDPKNTNHVQAITARPSSVTGLYLERITLTLSALSKCKSILLLITGENKRAVIEDALVNANPDLPVTHLIKAARNRLTILYTAG